MPTYALLGATGATGSAVLHSLLDSPPKDLTLNILVRSKSKLLRAFPYLESTPKISIKIIEGTSTSIPALSQCLASAEAVFMCVADNSSNKGVSLTADTVAAIIKTLETEQQKRSEPPTIIQLRSASLNPKLYIQTPRLVYEIVSFCLHYNHEDVEAACRLYESASKSGLLNYVYVDPPTIHDAFGTHRTGHKLIKCDGVEKCDKQETALSYADLGASFVEVASRRQEFKNQAVGVTATGKVKETWGVLGGYLMDGAKGRMKAWLESDEKDASKGRTLFLYCVPALATFGAVGVLKYNGVL